MCLFVDRQNNFPNLVFLYLCLYCLWSFDSLYSYRHVHEELSSIYRSCHLDFRLIRNKLLYNSGRLLLHGRSGILYRILLLTAYLRMYSILCADSIRSDYYFLFGSRKFQGGKSSRIHHSSLSKWQSLDHHCTKLLQKREMRKDIVIELSYKGFSRASDYS